MDYLVRSFFMALFLCETAPFLYAEINNNSESMAQSSPTVSIISVFQKKGQSHFI